MNYFMIIFNDVDFIKILKQVKEQGYLIIQNLISTECLEFLNQEILKLEFQSGNRNQVPLNQGTTYQVWQSHQRAYFYLGDPKVETANKLCNALGEWIK